MFELKICKDCLRELPTDSFSINNSFKDGREPRCKTCRREKRSRLRRENLELSREKEAKYRRDNKEKLDNLRREWKNKNPDKLRKYLETARLADKTERNRTKRENYRRNIQAAKARKRAYLNAKRENNPSFFALERIRKCVHNFLKGFSKNSRSLSYTGCDTTIQFLERMNERTDNKNWLEDGYQIDHLWQIHWFSEFCASNPCRVDDLCYKVNHYSNLRPLTKKNNLGRSYLDFSFITSESFLGMRDYLNKDICCLIEFFLSKREIFSGRMIMKCSPEERLILTH